MSENEPTKGDCRPTIQPDGTPMGDFLAWRESAIRDLCRKVENETETESALRVQTLHAVFESHPKYRMKEQWIRDQARAEREAKKSRSLGRQIAEDPGLAAYLRSRATGTTDDVKSHWPQVPVEGGVIASSCPQPSDHKEVMGCWAFYAKPDA